MISAIESLWELLLRTFVTIHFMMYWGLEESGVQLLTLTVIQL